MTEQNPMDDFIRRQGPAFIAHLLRRLSDEFLREVGRWYPEVGVAVPPRTSSTLLALDDFGPLGVTEISTLLHQSHPLVITWIKQLKSGGFIEVRADTSDRRRTVVALTRKGMSEVPRLRKALARLADVAQKLMDEAAPGLLDALWRMENACRRKPLGERLREHPIGRSTGKVRKRSS